MSPLLQALLKVLRGPAGRISGIAGHQQQLHSCVEGTKSSGVPGGSFVPPAHQSVSGVKRIEEDTALWLSAQSPLGGNTNVTKYASNQSRSQRSHRGCCSQRVFCVETLSLSWAVF